MTILTLRDLGLVGGGVLWTPSQISTALWLDAADASTITTVSSAVSQWNDKSGNNKNATQPTASSRPIYSTGFLNSLSMVSFDGIDDILGFSDRTLAKNVNAISYFFVAIANAPASSDYRAILDINTNPGPDRASVYFRNSTLEAGGRRLDNDAYQFYQFGAPSTSACIGSIIFNYSSATLGMGLNGSTLSFRPGGFQTAGLTSNTDNSFASIGGANNSNSAFVITTAGACNCRIGEFIAIQSAPSDAVRQLIEGYLAHKWGLTANLPANHPYKTTPPLI